MKIELIQPFINAADAVLAETLQAPVEINNVSMDEDVYRRKGIAASVTIRGDIEGRIIFDLEPEAAAQIAVALAGGGAEPSDELAQETVCELANMVIGNAVTLLNNHGFSFKVFAPELHTTEQGFAGNQETEALVMCFDTSRGKVYMNIALRYNRRRRDDHASDPAD